MGALAICLSGCSTTGLPGWSSAGDSASVAHVSALLDTRNFQLPVLADVPEEPFETRLDAGPRRVRSAFEPQPIARDRPAINRLMPELPSSCTYEGTPARGQFLLQCEAGSTGLMGHVDSLVSRLDSGVGGTQVEMSDAEVVEDAKRRISDLIEAADGGTPGSVPPKDRTREIGARLSQARTIVASHSDGSRSIVGRKVFVTRDVGGIPLLGSAIVVSYDRAGRVTSVAGDWPKLEPRSASRHVLTTTESVESITNRVARVLVARGLARVSDPIALRPVYVGVESEDHKLWLKLNAEATVALPHASGEKIRIITVDLSPR